jgi:hypothetical protein
MYKSQKSFAVLEGFLILVIIAVISGIGWYAIHTKHQTDKILSQADRISQDTPLSTKKSESTSTSQKYLNINEWGVRIPLTDTIKDAYYTPVERGSSYYNLRVHSLDSEANCTNSDLSVAAIERATTAEYQQSQNSERASNNIPQNSSKIGDYYYYIIHAQYDCSQSVSNDGLVVSVEKAFTDQTPNILAE